jgi:hypothetical protein
MTRLPAAATAALAVLALTPPAAALDPVAPPAAKDIGLQVVTINGTGCPNGTVAVRLAPDATAFSIDFVDTRVTPTQRDANCQLALRLIPPIDYTYAITRVDYSGESELEGTESGTWSSRFSFQGSPTIGPVWSYTVPNVGGWTDWHTTQVIPAGSEVYQPCDTRPNLNISGRLRIVTTSTDRGSDSMVDLHNDEGPSTVYHLTWAKCP